MCRVVGITMNARNLHSGAPTYRPTCVVERRVNFVEQTERTRLAEKISEQERHGHERAFARGERWNPLVRFPRGAAWISISLSRGSSSSPGDVALASSDTAFENHRPEVSRTLPKRFENSPWPSGRFARRLLQRAPGGDESSRCVIRNSRRLPLAVLVDRERRSRAPRRRSLP